MNTTLCIHTTPKTNLLLATKITDVITALTNAAAALRALLDVPESGAAVRVVETVPPSLDRFPRTALFLVQLELQSACARDELCALACRARTVQFSEPTLAKRAAALVQQVTKRAARVGFHLQHLRRRFAERLVVATAARPKAEKAPAPVVAVEETPEPVTLRSRPEATPEVGSALFESPFPRVAGLAASQTIVVLGGLDTRDVIARLTTESGIDVERIQVDQNRPRQIAPLAERIAGGRVGAVVVVNGFMSHATIIPVVDATRLANVPLAYAGKGGLRKLLRAFADLERQLRVAVESKAGA